MVDFNIKKYDIGGNNAIAGDGKLTGSEVKKAQKDSWTVWDGYSANDAQPENTKAKKKEAEKEYIDFDEFDKGGKDAIAGDGKLTGAEAHRARTAGYEGVYGGFTKDMVKTTFGERKNCLVLGGISRAVANKTSNKFAIGAAEITDLLLSALELPIAFGQALFTD